MRPFPVQLRFCQALILLIFLFAALATPAHADSCSLTVGWEPWKPYQFRNSDGELTGLDVEIVHAVAERLDCSQEYHQRPWTRTLFELEQGGLVTVAAGADRTPEREEYAYFSDPYRTESVYLYTHEDTMERFVLESLADIRATGFRLGITAGYHYGDTFDAHMEDSAFAAQVQPVRSDRQNHRKLMLGRIDGFLADPATTAAIARGKDYRSELAVYPATVKQDDIHVMFSKQRHSRELVERFNKALAELRESGEYEAIMERYLDY